MRIAINHTRFDPDGGVERYVWALTRRLLDAGHEVHYHCARVVKPVEHPRLRICRVPWVRGLRWAKVLSFAVQSERLIRRGDYDLVHGFSKTWYQDVYTDGSGCLADYQRYSVDGVANPLLRWWKRVSPHQRAVLYAERRRFAPGACRRVIAMSGMVAGQIAARYGLNGESVRVIYNGVDCDEFHPSNRVAHRPAVRSALGLEESDRVVLFLGNDYRRKGLDGLLGALARLAPGEPRLRLLVAGRDRRPGRFQDLARRLGVQDRVRWTGPSRAAVRLHAAADLLAFPSRYDVFGNVVLEAMATGLPVVVSRRAGASEVVGEGREGALVEGPEDRESLAAALGRLLDPATAAPMGEAARARAETLSWEDHFRRLLAVYDEVRR